LRGGEVLKKWGTGDRDSWGRKASGTGGFEPGGVLFVQTVLIDAIVVGVVSDTEKSMHGRGSGKKGYFTQE